MISQFFWQKIIKGDTIFYIQIILLQIPFLEFFFIRVIDFLGGKVWPNLCLLATILFYFEIMPPIKLKFG
jgi:hypothetical protein